MATKLPPPGNTSSADPIARSGAAGPTTAAQPVERVEQASAAAAVAPAAKADAVGAAAAVAAVQHTAASELIKHIADRLRRGEISSSQAVEELIDDAVRSNLPGLAPGTALGEELRALLHAYAKDDPYLQARVQQLGVTR